MSNQQPTDSEVGKLLQDKAADFSLSPQEKQTMRYNLMERISKADVTKSTNQGYGWWTYQLNIKGVVMPFLPILIAVLLAGGAGTAALADAARPGDTLYPVDQWMERMQTKLVKSENTRANLYAKFSEERLAELEALRNVNPSQLPEKAKELWEQHQQEATDRLAKSIEQVTALQEKFQEKLTAAENDSAKAAFQRVLDNLARVKTRREQRLNQMEDKTFPGIGRMPIMNKLKEWKDISKEEIQQIREEIKQEFPLTKEAPGNGQGATNKEPDASDSSANGNSSAGSTPGSSTVSAQQVAPEFRAPTDENGNIKPAPSQEFPFPSLS